MEYRIKFKCRHKELHNEVGKFIDDLLQRYGTRPQIEEKRFRKSVEVKLESPIDGRRSLKKLKAQADKE